MQRVQDIHVALGIDVDPVGDTEAEMRRQVEPAGAPDGGVGGIKESGELITG